MEGTATHFIKLKPSVQNIYSGKTDEKENPNIKMFHSWVELRAEFVKKHLHFGANSHNIIDYPEGPAGIIEHELLVLHRTPQ